ncbi:hypothetical protein [Ramlibacter sp.]|uniref:hypothetical protein n=1 Tax=Ramlibacter sp. TaxID=1917967 RepID=UPI003D0E3DF6
MNPRARAALPPPVKGSETARESTYAVFAAISERAAAPGFRFSTGDVREWVPHVTRIDAGRITARMVELGFARSIDPKKRERFSRFVLTREGFAGVRAAQPGQRRTEPGWRQPERPDSFIDRLWKLLRMRHVLDPVTAASTLVDAGEDERALKRAAHAASQYLRAWARQGFVCESRGRAGNGCKQYVLQKDAARAPVGSSRSITTSKT